MGAFVNMTSEGKQLDSANDHIVIRQRGNGIIGGRTLDMTGFKEPCIRAGHIVIQSTEDETIFKPMPVSDGNYTSLPERYRYAGVVVATKTADNAQVAIMYNGEVNDKASPYPVDSIKVALKAELPGLVFMHD